MKTSILRFKYFFLSMLFAFALSCSTEDGEDGAIGPQGIEGPAGIDGTDGADGADGADGQDGNANVVSVLVSGVSIITGTNTVALPELTQDIFDTGVVFGYVTVSGNTSRWESIPVVIGGSVVLDITEIQVGNVILDSTFDQVLDFRFVVVSGTSSTGKNSKSSILQGLKDAGVDINNYDQVMDYFGL